MSINSCTISGNLTADPELRTTKSGTPVLSLSLAYSEHVKADGESSERTNFIDCILFGKRAESVSKYVSKGQHVVVSGKLRYSTWEAADGTKRSKHEIAIDDIDFTGSKPKED